MKKVSLLIVMAFVVLLCNVTTSYGQYTDSSAILNVKLTDVQSVSVLSTQSTVNLNFTNAANYINGGVADTLSDHLQVVSTNKSGFIVSVKADDDLVNGTANIPIGDILIKTAAGSKNPKGNPTVTYTSASGLALSKSSAQQVINSPNGASGARFNVTYTTDPTKLDDFVGLVDNNGTPTTHTFTTTLHYTIVAK